MQIPFVLTGKVILILTPQAWGKMKLAKHHYAIELARLGNEVYFLNPPDNDHWSLRTARIEIKPESDQPGLFIIHQQLYFPYKLKFHSRGTYNLLIKKQIRDILRAIHKPIDILWSFDIGNLFPLSFFDKKIFKIFHPVDEPPDSHAISAALDSDVLFSVTREIIEKYAAFKIPSQFINHGLSEDFLENDFHQSEPEHPVNVALTGNFLRPDLDRNILLQIIRENSEVHFHFYGSYKSTDSNIGASEGLDTEQFIKELMGFGHVKMHGVFKTKELAIAMNRMDALLICYDMQLDQSKGTNYHKVMEYLSTGKVIISNNITTYKEYPEMIRMNESRHDNKALPALFRDTIINLPIWNSDELMRKRKSFAVNNTYRHQLERIGNFIQTSKAES